MMGFMDPQKVVLRKYAFSTLPSAQHECENRKLKNPWIKINKKS
jgi:hypothetical protein